MRFAARDDFLPCAVIERDDKRQAGVDSGQFFRLVQQTAGCRL